MADSSNREGTGMAALSPELVVVRDPDSEGAQAYRSVRETLRYAGKTDPIRSVLLADAGSTDHAGAAAANIGASFALNGDSTVLIDADPYHPTLHVMLNCPLEPGLLDWLSAATPDARPKPSSTGIDNLSLIPSGNRATAPGTSIADRLTARACRSLIDDLGAQGGYVIFHASVAPISSQALTIAAQVDAVLLIVRSGATKRTDAQRAKEALERVGASLLGAVLTEG